MNLPLGYSGKVAIIDLSREEAHTQLAEHFFSDYDINPRLWLGGDGIITKILWKTASSHRPLGSRKRNSNSDGTLDRLRSAVGGTCHVGLH
jgi:aldehyde:ferredoxin oxidoreductase